MDDWFVDWVEIKTGEPKITFRCNVNALLDPDLTDALDKNSKEKTLIGASCQTTGEFF